MRREADECGNVAFPENVLIHLKISDALFMRVVKTVP